MKFGASYLRVSILAALIAIVKKFDEFFQSFKALFMEIGFLKERKF